MAERLEGSKVARVEAAEAQRNEWAESRDYWRERAVAAERERDLARDYVASLHGAKSYEQMVSMADRLRAAEARVEAAEQRIEGIAALACDLLGAVQPWELQPAEVRSAATRLTVALAAIPLPAPPVPEQRP